MSLHHCERSGDFGTLANVMSISTIERLKYSWYPSGSSRLVSLQRYINIYITTACPRLYNHRFSGHTHGVTQVYDFVFLDPSLHVAVVVSIIISMARATISNSYPMFSA